MSDSVTKEQIGDVLVIRMDDGRVNALSSAVIDSLHAALDQAAESAKAVALIGRPGKAFSAGFDLTEMQQGQAQADALVAAGGALANRFYGFPLPVVLGCTGHSMAMGAVLQCAMDYRIGAAGPFKICFNEIAIGMTLPYFLIAFAEERLTAAYLNRAILQAEAFDPETAVAAGLLDETVPVDDVESAAIEKAQQMAENLNAKAFAESKQLLRGGAMHAIAKSLQG